MIWEEMSYNRVQFDSEEETDNEAVITYINFVEEEEDC